MMPPPFAVMVIVRVPVAARLPAVTVMVELPDPGAAMGLELKVAVWELPSPEAERVIAELKPPEMAVVIVAVPDELLAIVIAPGEAAIEKPATPEVTVSETVAVCVSPPPVPVIVML